METCDFDCRDYNVVLDPRRPSKDQLHVGEQCLMHVDGMKSVRVFLVEEPKLNENNELRAHVIVWEESPYIKAGAECHPLAFTLTKLP